MAGRRTPLAGVLVSAVSRLPSERSLVNLETRARVAKLARSLNDSTHVGAQVRPQARQAAGTEQHVGGERALRQQGRALPKGVLVMSCDDIALAAHLIPPLSTVAQPIAEAGRVLVTLQLALLAGE